MALSSDVSDIMEPDSKKALGISGDSTNSNNNMKARDLVILVKYAQGLVLFNSFHDYMKFLKPDKRILFFSQVVDLIIRLQVESTNIDDVISDIEPGSDCLPCVLLKEGGISKENLLKIVNLPESELESSFQLLLNLFTIGYKNAYPQNRNDPYKFWFWDYSEIENTLRIAESDFNLEVDLTFF